MDIADSSKSLSQQRITRVAAAGFTAALFLASCTTSADDESANGLGETLSSDSDDNAAADIDSNVTGATGIDEDPTALSSVSAPLLVESRDDLTLVDPLPVAVYEVTTNPQNDRELVARFRAPSPECFAVQGTAVESDTAEQIQVRVIGEAIDGESCAPDGGDSGETDPAAPSGFGGLNETIDQELVLALDEPVGQRAIDTNLGDFDDVAVGANTGSDSRAPFAEFANMPFDEATALADSQDIAWRVSRDNDEFFELSDDYDDARVNFEVDEGTVTLAVPG